MTCDDRYKIPLYTLSHFTIIIWEYSKFPFLVLGFIKLLKKELYIHTYMMLIVMVVKLMTMVAVGAVIQHWLTAIDPVAILAKMMVMETSLSEDADDFRIWNKGMSHSIVY